MSAQPAVALVPGRAAEDVAEIVAAGVARLCRPFFGDALRALILTGSMARGEATVVRRGGEWRVWGDAEFLVVLDARHRLPRRHALDALAARCESWLRTQGCRCAVSLGAAHPSYLRRLPPHIFGYELRAAGRVIAGEAEILQLIPPSCPESLPWLDAWHLLSNRIVEQLDCIAAAHAAPSPPPPALAYATVKLWLDVATSYLVFANRYAPSYRQRSARLAELAALPTPPPAPWPLPEIARQVECCTDWKLEGSEAWADRNWDWWREAVQAAARLWHWELAQLAGPPAARGGRPAWRRWAGRAPRLQIWRGWASAARHGCLPRGFRGWARARQAPPRLWIYRAAMALFSQAPALLAAPGVALGHRHARAVAACLPRPPAAAAERAGWRELASAIVENYRVLLSHTRA